MAVVTENWSAYRIKRGENAQRQWVVTGAADATAALAAVVAYGGYPNAAHPQDARLLQKGQCDVSMNGPASFVVASSYELPESGQFGRDENPLDKPIEVSEAKGTFSEEAEGDAEAVAQPIVDTAGFPYESNPAKEFTYRIITLRRNESTRQVSRSIAYEDHVNSDNFVIPLIGMVEPGQALCVAIEPTGPYTILSTYVPMQYVFWIRKGVVKDSDNLWDAWKFRLRSQGLRGWYDDSGTKKSGPFVWANSGERISGPILLDATGKPLETNSYKVEVDPSQKDYRDAVAAPSPLPGVYIETTSAAVYTKYAKFPRIAFSGLNLV